MSKLLKRISKISKDRQNCIVIGNWSDSIEELAEHFQNVFVLNTESKIPRLKNVIAREDFSNPHMFSSINFGFVDKEYISKLDDIRHILSIHKPILFLGETDGKHKMLWKIHRDFGYKTIEMNKNYSVFRILKGGK